MKKVFGSLTLAAILIGFVFVRPSGLGYAQGETPPTPTATPYPGEFGFITFEMLGLADEVMVGPYANLYIPFSTPDSWAFQSGAKLVLELDVNVQSSRKFIGTASDFSGALFEITLNGHVLDTVFLKTGKQTVEVSIPQGALYPTRLDGRQSLQIYMDATVDCLFDHETTVVLRNVSGLSLPHRQVSPTLDLALLPRPFFKKDSVLPEPLVILVPDAPTTKELQAAMTVAAAVGRMTQNQQVFSLASVSSLSQIQKENAHFIMVGRAASLPLLSEVIFPAKNRAGQTDGVINMALSPWNAARSVIYIGGQEDEGVLKAAQAFSSGALRTGRYPSLSVVSSIQDAVESKKVEEDRTLESLGYTTQLISGVGYGQLEYEFILPLGKTPLDESFFNLVFTNSALFDFDASSAIVLVNDKPLGSVRFSAETANQLNNLSISIPSYVLRPGRNTLTIQAEFIPLDYCSTLNDKGLWVSINQDSLLHIPLVDADNALKAFSYDLGVYPVPFSNNPSLADVGFVFPKSDILSWEIGAKVAADLGQSAIGSIITPSVFYADVPLDEALLDQHFIIIGQASKLPILYELQESMPAYFEPGSDLAVEKGTLINFNLPEGIDLGYLEVFGSPWSPEYGMMTILGSSPLGLSWAENAILDPALKKELHGDYAVVQERKIYAVDTKASGLGAQNLSATAVPGSLPTIIPDNVPVTAQAYQQDWVKVAIAVTSSAIVLLLLGIALRAFLKKRRE